MLLLVVSGRIWEDKMEDHAILWISFSNWNWWWVGKQGQCRGREEEGNKSKKSLKTSTMEKMTHTTKALLLSVTSGITGKKTMLQNNRQARWRNKACKEITRLRKQQRVLKMARNGKEWIRLAFQVWCSFEWIAVYVWSGVHSRLWGISKLSIVCHSNLTWHSRITLWGKSITICQLNFHRSVSIRQLTTGFLFLT